MDNCCIDKRCAVERLRERQASVLRVVQVAYKLLHAQVPTFETMGRPRSANGAYGRFATGTPAARMP